MHPFISLALLAFLFEHSLAQQDYYKYTNCTQPFDCGDIRNISFPFWGHNRAKYCGQPGYELRCKDDRIKLVTQTQTYRVINVNSGTQRLRIVSENIQTDSCPAPSTNVSFPIQRFSYSLPDALNITVFYGCPQIPTLSSVTYPCSPGDNSSTNYIWNDKLPPWTRYTEILQCERLVIVPILQSHADSFDGRRLPPTVQQIFRDGFEVVYTTDSSFCKNCQESDGHCGYDWNTARPMCFCYDGEYEEGGCPTPRPGIRASVGLNIAIGTFYGVGCMVLMALLFAICKCRRSSNSIILWKGKNKTQRIVEDFLKSHGSLAPKRYSYYDLKQMTNSFNDRIGQGGYGEVYKGKLLDDRLVAVKLLNDDKGSGGQDFINEVAAISRTSHVNVVSLLGFCFDGSKRALIYEFMVNGSLEKFIYDHPFDAQPHLGWEILYRVAIGVARGLEYLHRGCNTRILHFDIKPHNILLDIDFTPKISDFGLAKLCPRNESIVSMLDARGTAGYIAPELFNRQFGGVSHKSDVFSYGMMVLEIVGKRKNIDVNVNHTSEIYFPNWIHKRLKLDEDLRLNGIMSAEDGDRARKMILVALWCIQTNPMDRPAMTRVVEMLESTHELLLIPPNPYLCSPPRSLANSVTS